MAEEPKYIKFKDIRSSKLTGDTFIVCEEYRHDSDGMGGYYVDVSTDIKNFNPKDLMFTLQKKREFSKNTIEEISRLEKILEQVK